MKSNRISFTVIIVTGASLLLALVSCVPTETGVQATNTTAPTVSATTTHLSYPPPGQGVTTPLSPTSLSSPSPYPAPAEATVTPRPTRTPRPSLPTPIPMPPPTISPIGEGWSEYRNTVLDFSIEFPSDWIVIQDTYSPSKQRYGVSFYVPNLPLGQSDRVSLNIYNNAEQLSLQEWISQRAVAVSGGSDVLEKRLIRTPVSVGELHGERVEGWPSRFGSLEIFLAHDDWVFHFHLEPCDSQEPNLEQVAILDRMWQSLRFVSP